MIGLAVVRCCASSLALTFPRATRPGTTLVAWRRSRARPEVPALTLLLVPRRTLPGSSSVRWLAETSLYVVKGQDAGPSVAAGARPTGLRLAC